MSKPVVIGDVPWEKLIAQSIEPEPVRPPGSFTFAEWQAKTGRHRDVAYKMLNRLIAAGTVRPTEARVIKDGLNRRTILYVPTTPTK